jgi:hypothetical protein
MTGKRKRHSGVRKYALFANRMMKVLPSMAVFGKTAKGLALTAA